jgi:hypothetical protein
LSGPRGWTTGQLADGRLICVSGWLR